MRIIIISYGFTGSTLPLVKSFLKKGHYVECFYLADPGVKQLEALDFHKRYICPGIHHLNIAKSNLSTYFDYVDNLKINIVTIIRKRNKLDFLKINSLIDKIDFITINKLCKRIKRTKYDAINIIGHMYPMNIIANKLNKYRLWFSLHEVYNSHLAENKELTTVVKYAIDENLPIIVHSTNVYNNLNRYYSKINLIRFGLFETFQTYKTNKNNLKPYLLFFGYILPYKGLELLYKSYMILKAKGYNYPLVIAGKGYDEYLNLLAKEKEVHIISEYISNERLVSLINNCSCVICPYLSASQSGIPQTANALGKKVIATKVGAFPEVIFDNENGYLVEMNNPDRLAEIIIKALNDYTIHNFTPKDFIDNHPEFSWDYISSQYLNLFKKSI